jgi:hypothetical protein
VKEYRVEKDFIVDGYRCVVLGLSMGHRCGYVALPYGHPYNKIDDYSNMNNISVHGGLTYGDIDNTYPVKTDRKHYWIGFDCAHYNDARDLELIKSFEDNYPSHLLIRSILNFPNYGVLRTTEYVEEQLRDMVKQLIAINSAKYIKRINNSKLLYAKKKKSGRKYR